jgi:Cu-Zn family superoxide dismutase
MHFNPENNTHGDISFPVRHVGDYGNVETDEFGNIEAVLVDYSFSKIYGTYGVLGRTIVLHQLEDDLGLQNNTGSKTTGNAGARIACGVIGLL